MPLEKVIRWSDADQLFEPVTVEVELVDRSNGVPIALQAEPPRVDRTDVIELAEEEAGETRARWRVDVAPSSLAPSEFYEHIATPVTITIAAKPIESDTMALVLAGPVTLESTCIVQIEPPRPVLHWRGPPFAHDDAPIEIEADSEHEFELHTWVERYRPATRDVGPATEAVEFTHKTEQGFDPRLFGPHPADRPHVVAPAGGTNNRQLSRWISKASLPDPRFAGLTLPHHFALRCKVWDRGSITQRIPDEVRFRRDALIEVAIPCVLTLPKLVVEMVTPEEPFLADGLIQPIELRILRQRDHAPLKKGLVSWEILADTSLGGDTRPKRGTLGESDAGRVALDYLPPALVYRPGGRYREDLAVYLGEGTDRILIGTLPLRLRPGIKARIDLHKRGLITSAPAVLDLLPSESACEFTGHVTLHTVNGDPEVEQTDDVAHARVEVICDGTAGHGDIRTDERGAFTWRLPELDDVFARIPDRRAQELGDGTLPALALSPNADAAISLYEEKLRNFGLYEDKKLRSYAPLKFLDAPFRTSLLTYRLVYARQIAQRPEDDYPRIVSAADLLRVTTASAPSWQGIYDSAYERAIKDMQNFLAELASTLISVFEIGTKSAAAVIKGFEWAGAKVAPLRTYLMTHMAPRLERLSMALLDIASSLVGSIPPSVAAMFKAAERAFVSAGNALAAFIGLTDATTPWGTRDFETPLIEFLVSLLKGVIGIVKALAAAILAVGFSVASAAFIGCRQGLHYIDESLDLITDLGAGYKRVDQNAKFGFDKAMEIAFTELLKWTGLTDAVGSGSAVAYQFPLRWFDLFARDAFQANYDRAVKLAAPEMSTVGIDRLTAAFETANTEMGRYLTEQIFLDRLGTCIDFAVLIVEASMTIAGLLLSGGLAMAAYATFMSQLEILVGSLKSLVRLAQFGKTAAGAMTLQLTFHSTTLHVMD